MSTTGTMRSAPSAAVWALGLLTLNALTGCSEDSSAPSSTGAGVDVAAISACELLTPGEIEAATGVAAGTGRDVSQLDGQLPMCNWPRAGGPEYDVLVSVTVTGSSLDSYDEFVASARDSALGDVFTEGDVQEVDGVGNFGVWLPEAAMLQAYDDDLMVQVHADAPEGPNALEAARTLALDALAKLH